MGRIRSIKPEFFKHGGLYDLEKETGLPIRVAFAGLWTCCDREGRFKWRPRELKLDILPYDDCDISRVLDAFVTRGFVVKYEVARVEYGYIPSFLTHQIINNKESASVLPKPVDVKGHKSRVRHARGTPLEGKGKEGKGKEDISAVAFRLPLVGGEEFPVSENQIAKWSELYPAVNVPQELREMIGWLDSHPTRKKTESGCPAFITRWLGKAQDHAPPGVVAPEKKQWLNPDGTLFTGAPNDPRTAN